MNIKIAVIVPIYNAEKYLVKCIDSIINQTYRNLQIILVDDGSTDGSGEICDSYKNDSRIQVIHQKNGGSVRARKTGLNAVHAEYVAFVDADDYIEKNMYEDLLALANTTGADFVHSPYFVENSNGVASISPMLEDCCFELNEANRIEVLCGNIAGAQSVKRVIPGIWSKLYKTELARKCFFLIPDGQQLGEDDIFQCACLLEATKVCITKKAYYHYLFHSGSLSRTFNMNNLSGRLGEYWALENLFKKYGCEKELYEANKTHLINLLFFFVPDIIEVIEKRMNIAMSLSNEEKLLGKRIILWGCGKKGREIYKYLSSFENCPVITWVDTNHYNEIVDDVLIVNPEECREQMNCECDYVVVAVKKEHMATVIKEQCLNYGIDEAKIVWGKLGYKSIE